jgi:hypothetical protein
MDSKTPESFSGVFFYEGPRDPGVRAGLHCSLSGGFVPDASGDEQRIDGAGVARQASEAVGEQHERE